MISKDEAMLIWERLKQERKPLTPTRVNAIVSRLMKQKHKTGVSILDWYNVKDNLLLIAEFDLDLCEAFGLPVEYTSIIRPMLDISKTDIHAQKRAYDRTLRGWPEGLAAWYSGLINDALKVGAVSRSDGKEREAVFEDDEFKKDKDGKYILDKSGNKIQVKWRHLHFQCSM